MRLILTLLAAFLIPVQTAKGQAGNMDDRTYFAVLLDPKVRSGADPVLQAIVLWRGSPDWTKPVTLAERRAGESGIAEIHRRARLAKGHAMGTSNSYVIHHDSLPEMTVEGVRFPLGFYPDSALVVMVAVPDTGTQRTMSSSYIARAALPREYWSRTWTSGDTTFTVNPDWSRRHALLVQALMSTPRTAQFMEGTSAKAEPPRPFKAEEIPSSRLVAAVAAVDSGGVCAPGTPQRLPTGGRLIRYDFPAAIKRQIEVLVDSSGRPMSYSDHRGSGLLAPEPSRRAGPGTSIILNFHGDALAINTNTDTMPGAFRLVGRQLLVGRDALEAPNLGPAGPMLERVVEACDRK